MIVDSSAKPIPLTVDLWDKDKQHCLARLTMPEMPWPTLIRWRGRIFQIYAETEPFTTYEEIARKQAYREVVDLWDASGADWI